MDRERMEKISKALGDETRMRIFEAISKNPEMTCGEIVSMHGVTPATVSHHLKILQEAELIECRKVGQCVRNRPVTETVEQYAAALAALAGSKRRLAAPEK